MTSVKGQGFVELYNQLKSKDYFCRFGGMANPMENCLFLCAVLDETLTRERQSD
jgi:hypothetical protein